MRGFPQLVGFASASDFLEGEIVKHIFRTGSFTKPTVLANALLTTAAVDGDTGQFSTGTGVEVTNANAYARVDRPPLDANWAAPSAGNGVTSNVAAITFTTATGSWGTIVAGAITDSATHDAGNLLFHGTLAASKVVGNGDTFEYAAGAVTCTVA